MRLDRTKNAIRNTAFGTINRLVTIIFPFVVRTIFIETLGADYSGLNSLFSSILTVLNLAELGFSSAITYSMYKPIANDDHETINALLLYYKKVYRCVGCIVLGIGLVLIPFLPYFTKDNYPSEINVVVVYLVYLINTALSYFMYAYLSALITAFQREDLISKVNIVISIIMYILQIVALLKTKNYYLYIAIMPLFTVVNNIRTAIIAKRTFPQYRARGTLCNEVRKDIKEKVSGLMISKVCAVSRNAFDSIFISAFLGLTDTTIYNNYYYIMNSIVAMMTVITNSITAGAGNSVSLDGANKNYNDMNRMNFIYMWLSGWCAICLLCLYQPVMQRWMGEELMFPFGVVVCLCLYFYIMKMGDIRTIYVQAKGIWWQNRYRAIVEAICNLVLNYILGKRFGVYGIIVATIISLFFINFCYGSQLIFKYYFTEKKSIEYFKYHTVYALITCLIGIVTFRICFLISDTFLGIVLKGIICAIVPNILYFLIYRKTKIYKDSISWLWNKIKRKQGGI